MGTWVHIPATSGDAQSITASRGRASLPSHTPVFAAGQEKLTSTAFPKPGTNLQLPNALQHPLTRPGEQEIEKASLLFSNSSLPQEPAGAQVLSPAAGVAQPLWEPLVPIGRLGTLAGTEVVGDLGLLWG